MHCPNSRCHYQYQSHNDGNDLGRQFAEQMFIGQLAVNLVIRHILRCEARRNGAYFGNAGLLLFQGTQRFLTRSHSTAAGVEHGNTTGCLSHGGIGNTAGNNRHCQPSIITRTADGGRIHFAVPVTGAFTGKIFVLPGVRKVEVKQTAGIRLRLVTVSSTGPIRQRNR